MVSSPLKEEEPLIQSTYSIENESTGDWQSSEKSGNALIETLIPL